MNFVRDIDRRTAGAEVRIATNQNSLSGGRDRSRREALFFEHDLRGIVDMNSAEHGSVMLTAARVLVDDVDQLLNRVQAVTDDVRRLAPRGRDQFAADDEQPIIATGDVFLDDDG